MTHPTQRRRQRRTAQQSNLMTISICVPAPMVERIRASAAENNRSISQEVVYHLRSSLGTADHEQS